MNDTKKTKVLIIEDEEILLDVLSKKLEKENFEVIKSTDGENGLQKAIDSKPDIILLDIVLPKLDGYEVLARLKEKYGETIPPVIIISNSGQPVELEKAISLGAKDYIVKVQFTPEEVIEKMKRLLSPTEKPAGKISKQPSVTAGKGDGTRVLVVEDDQFLRDLLDSKLKREGFEVILAIDGVEGLDKISSDKPDIILLDIILPGVSGFDILKKVRQEMVMEIATTPIILLSNLGQESDIEKGRALGADDYLIKSNFTIDEIIMKIKKLLETRQKKI